MRSFRAQIALPNFAPAASIPFPGSTVVEIEVLKIMPATSRPILPRRSLLAILLATMLMPCLSLLAVQPPSKPFLDKNSFYLSSAGFKPHFANDAAAKKALHALPPHRFVIHDLGGGNVRYLYAEPQHCVCTFIGTKDAYQSYRAILAQPIPQADDVSPDYKTQVGALLTGDPVDMLGNPPYAAEYFRNYY
jgi:hypothetical protein